MGDVYTEGQYHKKQYDALRNYLITDTVRMSLLIDPSLDSRELENNLFLSSFKSTDKLIETHRGISQALEKHLERETLSNEPKGARR